MKNKLFFILLSYFISQNIISQVIIHEKTLGYKKDEILFETIELKDGTYLSLGWTFSIGNGENDFYLVKTDTKGNKIWEKTFGGYEKETGISIKEFNNGNLLLSGTTRSFGSGGGDCIFIITDKNGNKLKEFYHGSFGEDYLRESVITKDEKIIFVGYSNSFGHGRKDIIYGKFDLNGNLMWIKNIGGEFDDEGWGVIETTDSGYLVSGFITKSNSVTYSKNIKTDKDGIVIWEHERIQRNIEYGINSTVEDFNGGYISGHTIYNGSTGKSQIEIFKLSSTGQLISSKTYDKTFNVEFRYINKTICGYAIACSSWNQRDQSDIFLLFTDQIFNEIKSFTIDKGGKDNAWKLSTKNNKTILSGSITDIIDGNLDGIFSVIEIKKDENDSLKCINLIVTEDAAIGYHDFFSTSSTNFGNAIQLAAYTIPGALGGLNQNRALFKFNIPQELDSFKIVSAKLNLFATGQLGNLSGHTGLKNKGIIQKVIQPWDENTATWDNQPSSSTINQVILDNPISATENFLNINILSLFQDLQKENYGLILKQTIEEPTNALLFCSSDFPDTKKHPNVEVCYIKNLKNNENDTLTCDFIFYPNPTNQKINLLFKHYDLSRKVTCNIYSIIGQFIRKFDLSYPITTLDLEYLTSGIYILDINDILCQKTIQFAITKN